MSTVGNQPADKLLTSADLDPGFVLPSSQLATALTGKTLDSSVIGGTTPAAGTFTTLVENTGAAWTAYTPTISADSGTWGAVTVTLARYRILGKTLFLSFYLSCSVSSGAPTQARILLPAGKSGGYAGTVGTVLASNNGAVATNAFVINSTSTYFAVQVASGTFVGSCAFLGTVVLELA